MRPAQSGGMYFDKTMARLPRLMVPGALHHVVQRVHSGMVLFRDDDDYRQFAGWLREGARQFGVGIHAYVLLPDHFHLLLTPVAEDSVSKLMQWIGRCYVPYFNRRYQRSGSLWQGRFRATVLEAETYFVPCAIYIESHPVRAGLAHSAESYPWSSYLHHSGQQTDPLVSDHRLYWALGNTPFQREANYRQKMDESLSRDMLQRLSDATHKSWALGSEAFMAALGQQTQRRIAPAKRGRPRKPVLPASGTV